MTEETEVGVSLNGKFNLVLADTPYNERTVQGQAN